MVLPDKAKPIAVPTNGAEQGVAKIVAKNPLKKSFPYLYLSKLFQNLLLINCGVLNSKKPNKLMENNKIIDAIKDKNNGC